MSIQYSCFTGIQRVLMCQIAYPGISRSVTDRFDHLVSTIRPVGSVAVRITTCVDVVAHPALPATTYHIRAAFPTLVAIVGETALWLRSQNGACILVHVTPSRETDNPIVFVFFSTNRWNRTSRSVW